MMIRYVLFLTGSAVVGRAQRQSSAATGVGTRAVVEAHASAERLGVQKTAAVATDALRGLACAASGGAHQHHVVLALAVSAHPHRRAVHARGSALRRADEHAVVRATRDEGRHRAVVRGGVGGDHHLTHAGAGVEGCVGRVQQHHRQGLLVLVRAVDEAAGRAAGELHGAGVGGVVDGGAVEQHEHAQQLHEGPRLVPGLSERRREEIEDEHVRAPHRRGAEVVEDRVPDGVEHVGDEAGEDVVEQHGEEVHAEHGLHGGAVGDHRPGVVGVLERAVVLAGVIVSQRIQDEHADQQAPQALHANQQQRRRGGDVGIVFGGGHDLPMYSA
eukprot:Colp12_sorted_trinity150504_noHs@9422